MGNFIQWINPYPVDKIGAFLILNGQREKCIHALETDLSAGKHYPLFIQLGPGYRMLQFSALK